MKSSGLSTRSESATAMRWPASPCVCRSALSALSAMPTTITSAAIEPSEWT